MKIKQINQRGVELIREILSANHKRGASMTPGYLDTFEMWGAWEDGSLERVDFLVPIGGACDVAELAAHALGVSVSENLNMARK